MYTRVDSGKRGRSNRKTTTYYDEGAHEITSVRSWEDSVSDVVLSMSRSLSSINNVPSQEDSLLSGQSSMRTQPGSFVEWESSPRRENKRGGILFGIGRKRRSKGSITTTTTTDSSRASVQPASSPAFVQPSPWLESFRLLTRCDILCHDSLLPCFHAQQDKSIVTDRYAYPRLPEADFRRQHSLSAVEIAFVRSKSDDLLSKKQQQQLTLHSKQQSSNTTKKGVRFSKDNSHQKDESLFSRIMVPLVDGMVALDQACFDPRSISGGGGGGATSRAWSNAVVPIAKPICCVCQNPLSRDELDADGTTAKQLPCCKRAHRRQQQQDNQNASGSVAVNNDPAVCAACLVILTIPSKHSECRHGRCPLCRGWIRMKIQQVRDRHKKIHTMVDIYSMEKRGRCHTCCRKKALMVEKNTCDSCFLGYHQPLLYECLSCQRVQQIPCPLYRKQKSPESYGLTRWQCEGSCATRTHWRLCRDQIPLLLLGDVPWGQPEHWQEHARLQVTSVRRSVLSSARNKRERKGISTRYSKLA